MKYQDYLQTPAWWARSQQKLQDAGFKCQLCSDTGLLDVHHNTYARLGAELDTDLVVLCRECHEWHHSKARTEARDRLAAFKRGLYPLGPAGRRQSR